MFSRLKLYESTERTSNMIISVRAYTEKKQKKLKNLDRQGVIAIMMSEAIREMVEQQGQQLIMGAFRGRPSLPTTSYLPAYLRGVDVLRTQQSQDGKLVSQNRCFRCNRLTQESAYLAKMPRELELRLDRLGSRYAPIHPIFPPPPITGDTLIHPALPEPSGHVNKL